jgi:Ca2+-binding RTX toxin-like protein
VFGKSDNTAVELSDVRAGSGGFSINGVSPGDRSGGSVSGAGDVNGDGLADLIIGTRFVDSNGNDSGSSYVVFGKSNSANVQLSDVVASNGGFVINGVSTYSDAGFSVSNAGDVNGDGLDDLIVGARGASPNGIGSGAAFVVFGKTGNSAAVELSDVEAGTGGFVINGVSGSDVAGWSVSGAGDVNGDGLDDLVVGAPGDDPNGLSSGAVFIVYGKSDTAAVELSDLETGTGGVTWNGVSAYDRAGEFVNAAGDVDGDGFDDVIVLAPGNSDKAYVVRGTSDPFGFPPMLGDLGLNIFGIPNGSTVSGAGDVNGDGFDDVIVGSEGASSHVVFGRKDISGQVVQISDVEAGIGGFAITAGGQVSGIGDINGDGLDDLLVGEKYGSNSYVVFGRAAVDLVAASDSGASDKDNVTSDTTPTIAFQVDAGTVMEIDWDDGNGFVAAGVATGLLQQVTLATPYTADGVKNIQVRANGATTSADDVIETLTVTIDTTGPSFLPKVELSDIEAGTGGFVINGVTAGDLAGYSVSNAGDVNGDGLDDVIVGAQYADPNANGSGASYIVFGKTGDTAAVELSDVEAGAGGFAIFGENNFDLAGFSVSNAGDVNGDGLDDLFVGTPTLDANGSNSGGGFVVFGKSDGSIVELSDVAVGTGGFVVNGVSEKDQAGFAVSGAGDVNGDGLDDLIIGAKHDDPNGDFSGASFVVFGKSDGAAAELSDVEAGTGGFVINGVSGGDQSGNSVSSAGDVNGDGLDDLIIGAYRDDPNGPESGASFVVFGKSDGGAVELSDIDAGTGGFAINGVSFFDESGFSVSNAGDVNGDGLDDVIVGAKKDDPNGYDSGAAFVVFGKSDGAAVELSDVEAGSGGFVINGVFSVDTAGESVSGAGDLNGDGLDDLIVGASGHDTNNISAGASFVVFGKTDGAPVELEEVATNAGGFAINGISIFDRSGHSVSNAGDVNGDGLVDLIVGAPYDNPHGNDSGASFVIFGRGGGLDLLASSDDGAFDDDNRTADPTPMIEFTVEADAVLEIDWDDGNGFQDLGVATGQTQQATLAVPYATNGLKTIQMRTTDAAGNQHTESLSITIEPIVIQGTAAGETLLGNTQDNTLLAFDGNDILEGGPGADVLDGGNGFDKATYFSSAAGVLADIVFTGANTGDAAGDTFISIENLEGSVFDDSLRGNDGANTIVASAGNDTVFGRGGDDRLQGYAGDDILIGGTGGDKLEGGSGQDEARYHQATGGLKIDLASAHVNTGEATGDTYTSIENLFGSNFTDTVSGDDLANVLSGYGGNDTINGRGGADLLLGGDGDDNLIGGAGVDHYNGGNGIDRVQYQDSANGLRVDLQVQTTNTGEAAGETYLLIEDIVSSSGNDSLFGNASANKLYGFDGADRVFGRAGDDILFGGDGNDIVNGGAGDDILVGGQDVDTFRFDGADFG